jgi:hypothetical protein
MATELGAMLWKRLLCGAIIPFPVMPMAQVAW